MRYQTINKYDCANGSGIRTSIFFTGCTHKCKGCFNYEIWSFKSGKEFNSEAKELLFSYLSDEHSKGLSVLGGEPLQQDLTELKKLLSEVKESFPTKDIWLWTGYYLSELNNAQREVISLCDYVVDGRFYEDKKNLKLMFRGSSNQTIWDNDGKGNFTKNKLNDIC